MFCVMGSMEYSKHEDFITVYPKNITVDSKGNYVYPKEDKIGFFCKSISKKDILYFKGGFSIEKCSIIERVLTARKWYFDTKQQLPRKTKKKLISTRKRSKEYLKILIASMKNNHFELIN